MLVIYIIMSQNDSSTDIDGNIRTTPQLIGPGSLTTGSEAPIQTNYLTFETAPRNTETIAPQISGHNGNDLSYRHPVNTTSGGGSTSTYGRDEINPMRSSFTRPVANPYFLFFGKFCSQTVQNTDPKRVGHFDKSITTTLWQQPSNVYNIPDKPKDYILIRNTDPGSNPSGINDYPDGKYDDTPTAISTSNAVIYDASSCPVNWRMYEPIRSKVTDWSNNGVPANYVNFKAGRYVLPSGSNTFSNSTNPAVRNVAGVYFNETQFDVSYNPTSQPNAYFELKPSFVSSLGSGSGSGGTGTDLSFNNYFFKQPEMPLDCSAIFQDSSVWSGSNDRIRIQWQKPFHRKTGQNIKQEGKRYFYEDAENESWLPHFSELVFDISGGGNNRKFCQDICGNFVDKNGVSPGPSTPFAIISANNKTISLEATASGGSSSITTQWVSGGSFNYGTNGQTTTIIDSFVANPTGGNYAGGSPQTGDIGLGNLYDFALYYRNESKLNSPPDLSSNDLYYNKHNPCILRNIVFGVPGFIDEPTSLEFFQATGSTTSGDRYYLGGSGPTNKDIKDLTATPINGLNLPWSNTALIKVGYDCSLNYTRNSGSNRVQVLGVNGNSSLLSTLSSVFDVSYNLNNSTGYPINMTSSGTNSPATLRHWPSGGNSTIASWSVPDGAFDYISHADELGRVPSPYSGSHPEHLYTADHYHAVNDTENASGNLQRAFKSSYSISKVIPIPTRSVSNLTGDNEYENVMTTSTTWKNDVTFEFVDENTNTTSSASTDAVRRRTNCANEDVYFIGGYKKLRIKGPTASTPYKQMANYSGTYKSNPTSQTLSQLIDTQSYIGTQTFNASTQFKLSEVVLTITNSSNESVNTLLPTNSASTNIDIYAWDTNSDISNNLNPSSKNSNNVNYELSLSTGQTFDIAEDENTISGIPEEYSNKMGYYLGFDISRCECYVDLSSNYVDTGLLRYEKYELELKHTLEKNGATATNTTKTLEFHVADITTIVDTNLINIQKQTTNPASGAFNNFFGLKRLPGATFGNNLYKQASSVGGTSYDHLEMHMGFEIENVNALWVPPNTAGYNDNKFIEFKFSVDPTNISSSWDGDLDPNPSPGASNNRFTILWTDNIMKGTPPANTLLSTTIDFSIASSNDGSIPINNAGSNSAFFVEINEGQEVIVGTNGNGDGHYSRAVTEATSATSGRALLGVYNSNVKYANNYKQSGWAMKNRNVTSIVSGTDGFTSNDFKFGSGSGKSLFWDYTFQVNTSSGNTPSTFSNLLILQHTAKSNNLTSSPHVLVDTYSGSQGANYLWGNTTYELINMEAIMDGISSANSPYNHDVLLPDYQSMWSNGYFHGGLTSTPTNAFDNPYIDYTRYYNQPHDYSGKMNSGLSLGTVNTKNVKPSGTPDIFTPSGNYKVLLFRVNITNKRDFNIKVFSSSGSTTALDLGSDYFLFYSEYHTTNNNAFTIEYSSGNTTTSAWSGWLQPFTIKNYSTSALKTFNYSMTLGTSSGGECGVAPNVASVNWTVQKKNPHISGHYNVSTVKKYICIYIKEDIKVGKIECTIP